MKEVKSDKKAIKDNEKMLNEYQNTKYENKP